MKGRQEKLKAVVTPPSPNGEPLVNRIVLAVVALALTSTALAGCLGGDDLDSAVPQAVVTVAAVSGQADTYSFDGSKSKGLGLMFNWTFGDGTYSEDPKTTHTYVHGSGVYKAQLTLTDANGITARWSESIKIGTGENAPPIAFFTPSVRLLEVGEPFTVDASATIDPDGDPIRYEWDFNFPMRITNYEAFRQSKEAANNGEDEVGNKSDPSHIVDDLDEMVRGALDKDPGHGPDAEPAPSMFDGRRSTTEPIYTLQEGFPDETWFYVKLTAIDIKGASERIISEDMWAVEVLASKDSPYYSGTRTGTFDLGASDTVAGLIPADELSLKMYDEWTFPIPGPLMDLGRNLDGSETGGGPIPTMFINLTWDTDGDVAGDVQMRITIPPTAANPDGEQWNPTGGEGSMTWRFSGSDNVGEGDWVIELWARSGMDFDYTVTYWAMIDQNPFRDVE